MSGMKDTLAQLEDAYSFLRDPQLGMAIEEMKLMQSRIFVLEDTLRDVLTFYTQLDAAYLSTPKAIDNAWRVLEDGL